ncbi:MAG: primosomal protein N' [Rikenellaceae bacterium]
MESRGRYADILLPLAIDGAIGSAPLTYAIGDVDCREGDCVAVEMGFRAEGNFYTGVVWRIHDEKPDFKRIRTIIKRLYDVNLLSSNQRKFWDWISDYYLCSLGDVMRGVLPAMIKPHGEDQASFELAQYQPAHEMFVAFIGASDDIKLTDKQRAWLQVVDAAFSNSATPKTALGEVARRLIDLPIAPLRLLEKKGIITLNERERAIEKLGNVAFNLPSLTPHQQEALQVIRESDKRCALLHGVTGSGKTELYIHLIAEQLAQGKDVLMLVPEIALTTQLIERMEIIFGSRVTPYHSKIAARKRTETFMQMAQNNDGGNFIVGARSAIFLPLNNLGLIIVDEEHDSSYKQMEPAPLYNARDAAQVLAGLYGARIVLGSATPSLESWMNAKTGKFALAELTERFGEAVLPDIIVSNSQMAGRRGERKGHFNAALFDRIKERFERGEQSMLFQNRRGFAPYVECTGCGWVPQCPHCNVSLTMHKSGASLRCHYCDYAAILPSVCPTCHDPEKKIEPRGFGTEKIEEQLAEFLPDLRTTRLDRDTASSTAAFERIIGGFKKHESDVMVGTQMIAKGFDFERVTLVGILNADNMLNNPDFRAEERAFALMTQVAGRAGRRKSSSDVERKSEVVIQTTKPDHRIMEFVRDNDYDTMARTLLKERKAFFYPPYSRLIEINLYHKNMELLYNGANLLSALLIERFGSRVRGPVAPPVDRVNGVWRVGFILKIESGASSMRAREVLKKVVAKWLSEGKLRGVDGVKNIRLCCNVDPQ